MRYHGPHKLFFRSTAYQSGEEMKRGNQKYSVTNKERRINRQKRSRKNSNRKKTSRRKNTGSRASEKK